MCGRRRTDDGPLVYYKLTLSAFGSRELKSREEAIKAKRVKDRLTCIQVIMPLHDKTKKMACAPSEDSDQPGHPPRLITLRCPHEEILGP